MFYVKNYKLGDQFKPYKNHTRDYTGVNTLNGPILIFDFKLWTLLKWNKQTISSKRAYSRYYKKYQKHYLLKK